MWQELLVALGLVMVIEGLMLAAFPRLVERAAAHLSTLPVEVRRVGGIFALAAGVLLVWFARG